MKIAFLGHDRTEYTAHVTGINADPAGRRLLQSYNVTNHVTIYSIRSEELQAKFNTLAQELETETLQKHAARPDLAPSKLYPMHFFSSEFKIAVTDNLKLMSSPSFATRPDAFDISHTISCEKSTGHSQAYIQAPIRLLKTADLLDFMVSFPQNELTIGNSMFETSPAKQQMLKLGADVTKFIMEYYHNEKVDFIFGNHDITEPLEASIHGLVGIQFADMVLETI